MFYFISSLFGCGLFDTGKIEQTCEDLSSCNGEELPPQDTAVIDSGVEEVPVEETGQFDTGETPEPEIQYLRPTHFSISASFHMIEGHMRRFEELDRVSVMLSIESNQEYFDPADIVCTFSMRSNEPVEEEGVPNVWFAFSLQGIMSFDYGSGCEQIDPELLSYLEYNLSTKPLYIGTTNLNNAMIPYLEHYAEEQMEIPVDELLSRVGAFVVRSSIDGAETTIYPGVVMATYREQFENPDYYYSEREIETRMDGVYWSIPLRSFSIPSY